MPLNRRHFLRSSSLALLSAALLPRIPTWAQEAAAGFRDLRRGVGLFTGRGGTIGWLISPDALLVVDSQFPQSAGICLEGLQQRSARAVDALINTHHHGDHAAGNGVFREVAKLIVAHEKVPGLQESAARQRGTAGEQTYADTTFAESWRLEAGDETVVAAYHGPAHTGGDSVVHFKNANVVHMGDLVFNRWHPFIDRQGGASVRGWIEVLERVLDDRDAETLYVFGHGDPRFGVTGSHEDVAYQRDYFSALLEVTGRGIREGKSVEEIGALEVLPGFPDHASPGSRLSLASNIAVAHEELTAD